MKFSTLVLWIGFGCSILRSAAQPETTIDELRNIVRQKNQALLSALVAGDADAFASVFGCDAVYLTPGMPLLWSRKQIREDKAKALARVVVEDGSIVTLKLEMVQGMAYEVGRFSYSLRFPEQPLQIVSGHYLVVWTRDENGQWAIQVDAGVPD